MRALKLVLLALVSLVVGAVAQSLPTATLTASDGSSGARLGTSVVIRGSTVAAGASLALVNGQNAGAVYVFTKASTAPWIDMNESARLVTGNPSGSFGDLLAMNGDGRLIVVGTGNIFDSGQLYLFVKPAGGWKGTIMPSTVLILASPPRPWINPGQLNAVAINSTGTTIVAGAADYGYEQYRKAGQIIPASPDRGAAYVWTEPANGWTSQNGITQTATLTAPNPATNNAFGTSVAISANTIVVGDLGQLDGAGIAYLFQRPKAGVWADSSRSTAALSASDAMSADKFGTFVAAGSGGSLVAVGNQPCCTGIGKAYVFAKPSTGGWPPHMTQNAELTASDYFGYDFGSGIAVGNGLVVVGAPGKDQNVGASYTFAEPSDGWTDMSLPASMVGPDTSGRFGTSNSISGGATVIGAPTSMVNGNNFAGAVYVFSQ
jgi:hypothetical protein